MIRKLPLLLTLALAVGLAGATEREAIRVTELEWPREYPAEDGSKLVLYQPQVTSWDNYELLKARAALAFSSSEVEAPKVGAVELEAKTRANLEERLVNFYDLRIVSSSFPSLDTGASEQLRARIAAVIPKQDLIVSLDRILAAVERGQSQIQTRTPDLKPEPPKVFVSVEPSILVQFDGKPIFSPIENNDLQFGVNTNWDVFFLSKGSTYYLRNEDAWYKAPAPDGAWSPAGKLPKAFKKLPKKDPNWTEVRQSLPGRKIDVKDVPKVFYSEEPAELLLINGEPALAQIEDTNLLWVTNTESDLFLDGASTQYYYLVSGRWFRAEDLEGPWEFATDSLPPDFSGIPEDHPRAHVLASVPATPQAEEAVILAHIPQKATVERGQVTPPTVSYIGDPDFKAIDGTAMAYATNTQYDVIRADSRYYLCYNAVWFVSTGPTGPWEVTDDVPEEIYSIPASSPVHNTTYVHVYDSTPHHVTFGYTSGYWGVYYGWGCMVYGTGWYWSPYYYWPPYYRYPIYYPYPLSYGAAAWYNPHTGTYGRGASVYGPFGGMGRAAAYNPSTGTYARGGSAWGPYNARGWAEAYNPRTATSARTVQGRNVYSNWGATGVRRGDDWVRTARYSSDEGALRGWRTSEGGSGFVGRDDNNLYAGRDGNVYRRNEDGWQKYDGGDWSPVEDPSRPGQLPEGASQLDRSQLQERAAQVDRSQTRNPTGTPDRYGTTGAARSAGASGSTRQIDRSTMDQLNRDAYSRYRGGQSAGRYQSWRSSGGTRGSYGGRGSFGGRAGGMRRR